MKTDDLENELRNLKNIHLTESELAAYCDREPGQMRRARVEAHLKQCFICEQQLARLREESAALRNRQVTANDIEFVDRLMEQRGLEHKPSVRRSASPIPNPPWAERLTDYLQQLTANWQSYFMQLKRVRGATPKDIELWQWQSDDATMRARAWLKPNAALVIRISSSDLRLDGARLKIRARSSEQEARLQRVSESEVCAEVEIPRNKRPRNPADISIEIA